MKTLLYFSLILAYYSSNAQVNLTSNLQLCLPFNGNASDMSGNGNNGTVVGASLTTDRFSNPSSAYSFSGAPCHIAISSFSGMVQTNELTISMWAKSNQTTSNCLFELISDTPHDRCVGCAQYANGGSTMMIWDWGSVYSNGRTTNTGVAIDITNWHHYVYIVSQANNKKEMYLDGVSVSSGTYSGTCFNKNKPLYIGCDVDSMGGSLRWNGSIDDVSLYNRALNAAEVNALYTGTSLICSSVGIKELSSIEKGVFYLSSPDNNVLSFTGDYSKLNRVEVFSYDGKLVKEMDRESIQNSGKIDNSNLSSGLYIIKYRVDESNFTQKIIINK